MPGTNTQGATLEETRADLQEAVEMTLETNRLLAEEAISDQELIRESLAIS